MKQIKPILYFLLGLALVLLDVSFLSNFEIYGATIVTSFIFLVILAISDRLQDFMYFSLSLVILFAVFSSLSLAVILLNFVLLPLVISYVRRKYLHVPNKFAAILYFLIATFCFEFILVAAAKEFNQAGALMIGYFTILNTFLGFFINIFYRSIKQKFSTAKEIRM